MKETSSSDSIPSRVIAGPSGLIYKLAPPSSGPWDKRGAHSLREADSLEGDDKIGEEDTIEEYDSIEGEVDGKMMRKRNITSIPDNIVNGLQAPSF